MLRFGFMPVEAVALGSAWSLLVGILVKGQLRVQLFYFPCWFQAERRNMPYLKRCCSTSENTWKYIKKLRFWTTPFFFEQSGFWSQEHQQKPVRLAWKPGRLPPVEWHRAQLLEHGWEIRQLISELRPKMSCFHGLIVHFPAENVKIFSQTADFAHVADVYWSGDSPSGSSCQSIAVARNPCEVAALPCKVKSLFHVFLAAKRDRRDVCRFSLRLSEQFQRAWKIWASTFASLFSFSNHFVLGQVYRMTM